jgi:hypothetical protein
MTAPSAVAALEAACFTLCRVLQAIPAHCQHQLISLPVQVPGEQHVVTGTVIRDNCDDGAWPPVFTVRLPDARTVDVTHAQFTAIGRRHSAQATSAGTSHTWNSSQPPDALPSVPQSLPGAPSARALCTLHGAVTLKLQRRVNGC